MLIGHYVHGLDDKKRLSIPSKWRSLLGKKVVMTSGLDKSLFVFSTKEWQKIAEKLSACSFTSPEARKFTRFFLANAFDVDIDSMGRILIPQQLINFAELKDKIVLAGIYNRIEIWDDKIWEKYSAQNNQSADQAATKLSEIGIF